MMEPTGRRVPINAPFAFSSGVLMILAESLLHPAIILIFFVSQLTDSLNACALVIAVGTVGWYLPQLIAPRFTTAAARQLPWALGATIVRTAAVVFLAYTAYRDGISDKDRLRSFFICYAAYSLASGFARTPTGELVGRSLARERGATVLRQRNLWGLLLAIGGGIIARQTLDSAGPAFPRNAGLLFIAAAAAMLGATYFLARLNEPITPHNDTKQRSSPASGLFQAIGDGALRRFIVVGMAAGLASLADPFILIYARRQFQLPNEMVGSFLAIFFAGLLLSTPIWAAFGRAGGARAIIQSAMVARAIAPLTLLLIPYLIDTKLYRDHVDNPRMVFYLLAIPFAVLGVATRGFFLGNSRYLADIALPRQRTIYHGLALTPMVVAAAAPFLGVRIIDQWGFDRLFLAAAFLGLVAVLCAGLLANTSMRVRTVSRSWRLRDAHS